MSSAPPGTQDWTADVRRMVGGAHAHPHAVLGPHADGTATLVRAFHPDSFTRGGSRATPAYFAKEACTCAH